GCRMRDEKSQFAITDEGFVIYKRHLLPFNVCDAAWLRASSSHNNADPVAFMRSDSDCSEPSPPANSVLKVTTAQFECC
ncbi:hypothetical protein AB8E22_23985, partial [Salmonella enterica]